MDATRTITAVAVQLSPVLYSREQTTEKVCAAIRQAGRAGADIVVFPETIIPYYPYFAFITPPVRTGPDHMLLYEQAVTVPGPTVTAIAQAARESSAVVAVGVTERDHGTLYNTQLIFDADGRLALRRRKITPTFHERMIWGRGDGAGLKAVDTACGRVGALACWEHYNPLARYALMADHEALHVAMFPGSLVGRIFAEQIEVTIRHHALESGCFVLNSTAYLHPEQVAKIAGASGLEHALQDGCFTAIIAPDGSLLGAPLREGEGMVRAELDLSLIIKRKRMMDSVGHYARPELMSLWIDRRPTAPTMPMPAPSQESTDEATSPSAATHAPGGSTADAAESPSRAAHGTTDHGPALVE